MSFVKLRSPSKTWIKTTGWLSAAVERIWLLRVGIVVPRLMSVVITPPARTAETGRAARTDGAGRIDWIGRTAKTTKIAKTARIEGRCMIVVISEGNSIPLV